MRLKEGAETWIRLTPNLCVTVVRIRRNVLAMENLFEDQARLPSPIPSSPAWTIGTGNKSPHNWLGKSGDCDALDKSEGFRETQTPSLKYDAQTHSLW